MQHRRKRKGANRRDQPQVDIEAALREQRERHRQAEAQAQAASSSSSEAQPAASTPAELPGFVYDAQSGRYYRASGLRNPFSSIPIKPASDSQARSQHRHDAEPAVPQRKSKHNAQIEPCKSCLRCCRHICPVRGCFFFKAVNVVDQLRAREWSTVGRCHGDMQPFLLTQGETQQMQFAEPARAADVDYCPALNLFMLPGDS